MSTTTTGFRTDHDIGATEEPNFEQALEFFQVMALVKRRHRADNTIMFAYYPDIEKYLRVEHELRDEDAKRRKRRDGRGLTAYLSDLLGWRRRWQATFFEEKEQEEMGSSSARPHFSPNNTAGKVFYSSLKTGRLVDEQIERLSRGETVARAEIHAYTKWFIQYLYQRQWVMCGAQVPLWSVDEITPVSTRADALVYDLVNECFCLIELKTGYDNDYEALLHLREPGDQFDDSYYWCHQHQLGWMMHKIERRLVSVKNVAPTGIVLRISECVGVRAPHLMDADVALYYHETHERHLRDVYLVASGNSMDPFAMYAHQP